MHTLFFQQMFEKHHAIMLLIDPITGQIMRSNQAASRFYGYSPDQLKGMHINNISRLPSAEIARRQQAAMQEKENYFITPHYLASGEVRTVEVHISPITWGEHSFLFAIIHDITERQRAEEALRENERKLQTLFELLPVGISVLDTNNEISFKNTALRQILQLSYEDLLQGDYRQRTYLHADGTPMMAAEFPSRRAIREQQPVYDVEIGIVMEDNEIIWTSVSAVPVIFANWQVVIITHNITSRKQVEEELTKLAQVVEQSGSSIVITDLSGQIEFVNHAFTQVTGYRFDEAVGQNSRILKSGRQSAQFYDEMWTTLQRQGEWQGEFVNKKKNGEFYWEHSHITVIKNSQGQITHYVAIKDDITKHKQMETELHVAHEQLKKAYDETLEGWVRALDLRDKETEGHSRRVMEITVRFAQRYGLPELELIHIRRGALLHDIGKMGIPDNILLKPSSLNEFEQEIMRLHPLYAYEMLHSIKYLQPALDIPYCHHEKWDGTGYPRGLKGEEIPVAARLFALVDVWDALAFDRPYRLAWPKEKIYDYILSQSGSHFDPQLVPLFLQLI